MNETESETKKTLVNIKVNDSTLKDWKQFCLDNDMTLTAAIKRAMQNFMTTGEKGNGVKVEKVEEGYITLQLSKDTLQKLVTN